MRWSSQWTALHHVHVRFYLFPHKSSWQVSRAYLVLSTFCLSVLGYSQAIQALGITYVGFVLFDFPNCDLHGESSILQTHWSYDVPEVWYILIYLLSVVLCLAVGIMLSYHLWGIASGETSVESQDHEIYRSRAKSRGEVCAHVLVLILPWFSLVCDSLDVRELVRPRVLSL